ncbi:hypothetical protein CEF21_08045 [Bacillus sp. FJAT-42376]|uniref:hypothetical protein n=1 Tax=Bacillus sp. FJAT-42376 TaxID=2014076 RepID=UPI000F4F4D07|nr:hypothetical protein [Bacillus sp. FJAT-42376]AZB42244.1 hypothetical protein CEF21_08045 [Bacillus sp. FJAT-42376]
MNKIAKGLVTMIVLGAISWGVSNAAGGTAIDYAFFVGLGGCAFIHYFFSTGGAWSNSVNSLIQSDTGTKMNQQPFRLQVNVVLLSAAVFTFIALIAMLVKYASYF